jgi:hypothetical protein
MEFVNLEAFYVCSMYNALINNAKIFYFKPLWKIKIPLKIKIFMWYLIRGVALMKDNLAKRRWQGSKTCVSKTCVLLNVITLDYFGDFYIVLLVQVPRDHLNIFLDLGCIECISKLKI